MNKILLYGGALSIILLVALLVCILTNSKQASEGAESIIAFKDISYRIEKVGEQYIFEGGVAYRRQGLPVQLSLSGTHYEMGKQHGALMQNELREMAENLYALAQVVSKDEHIPLDDLYTTCRDAVMTIAEKTPERYKKEIEGIAEGSGVSVETIYMINFFGEAGILMGDMACTSIIARTPEGKIIHARNEDTDFGMEIAKLRSIVKYNPTGYNSHVSIGAPPGYIGVTAGYNAAGLALTNNGLYLKEDYPEGLNGHLITRRALEECQSLDDVYKIYDTYSEMRGSAHVWSDKNKEEGVILETAPPGKYSIVPLQDGILIQINRCIDRECIDTWESPFRSNSAAYSSRKRIINNFKKKEAYDVDDIIAMLRTTIGPDGSDYSKSAFSVGISNVQTLSMVIFDQERAGFYHARDNYHASQSEIYFYPDNFEQPPILYKGALLLEPVVKEISKIQASGLFTKETIVNEYIAVAEKYPNEAYVQCLVGLAAFNADRKDIWEDYTMRAFRLDPELPEYAADAAAVNYYRNNMDQVIQLLLNVSEDSLSSLEYKGKRLALLASAYSKKGNTSKSEWYWQELEERIEENEYRTGIQEYPVQIKG